MAVVVQTLVPATAAGVTFTYDPIDGSDALYIEACLGIGEALVSGKVTPDRFVFQRSGLKLREVVAGDKRVRVVPGGTGDAVVEQSVPEAVAAALSIDRETAREVARLGLRAEELFGVPVDVEWAFDGRRVWLLQARPITTLVPSPPADAEPVVVWSNVNTGEILPDVASPITWSIIHEHAQDIFGGALGAFGVDIDARDSIGLQGGRIYFNVTILRDSVANFPGMDIDRVLGGMHDFVEIPDLPPAPRPRGARRRTARALLVLPIYVWRHTSSKAELFVRRLRAETDEALAALSAEPGAEEAYRIEQGLVGKFASFSDSLAYMMVGMLGFGALTALTNRWLDDRAGALANRLVAGRGDVASAEAGHALWRLGSLVREEPAVREAVLADGSWRDVRARLERAAATGDAGAARLLAAWDAFMVEHGHHRRGELEFANPTWAERPDYILGVVRGYVTLESGEDPMHDYARRSAEADDAAEECRRRLRDPLKRAAFGRMLAWGRASAGARENIKSEGVRWLASIRRALLVLGRRMAERGVLERDDDIFFLDQKEVDELVAGAPERDWRRMVARRRAEHERLRRLQPPPVIIGSWDEREGAWNVSSEARTLRGISVSSGVARGPARVFSSADTDERVMPGEILVAPFTDPGWTPYFVPAAGIVMDMGGMLSHGSIIAREYGIPAVVNVGPATRLIRTGQLIEVDGEKGEVRILG